MNIARIREMLKKEFIQVFRDPRMRGILFIAPVIQLMVFGYAVTTDVRHVATAVMDADRSEASREVVARFARAGHFDITAHVDTARELRSLIDHGRVQAVLCIRHGFAADLRAGRTASLQLIVDGTDSNTAGIILDYGSRIVGEMSASLRAAQAARSGRPPLHDPVELRVRAWFNENLESRNFYVPGVIALLVMLITLILTSMAVVREREMGTMEQLIVSPITPAELIIGKTIPFAIIGFVDVILITLAGVFWFEIPIRGSILLLLVSTALYLMTALGLGLLISTLCRTQQQAMMSTFFFFFPAVLLSGLMFPIANMPQPIQWLTYLNPLRYFIVIVRSIFLKGSGIDVIWPQMLALAIIGVVTLRTATSRFRKTLA